jgi:transcriptional regulator with XRE-family HTH domain
MSIRVTFARLSRTTRVRRHLTQQQVADAVGVSRSHIAKIELGQGNPSLRVVERIASALELELDLAARSPIVVGTPDQRDLVHARCLSHVEGRLRNAGWATAREVEIVQARSHGWIDLVAFDRSSATVAIIEIKTRLDDLGAIERQIGWYERSAYDVARRLGWQPRLTVSWLLVLASNEVETTLRANRELMAREFPERARVMTERLAGSGPSVAHRGMALIDPRSRRRRWLIPSGIDGRRSAPPYATYADAARRLGGWLGIPRRSSWSQQTHIRAWRSRDSCLFCMY